MSAHGSSATGARQGSGGMSSATETPATAGVGETKPKVFDEKGAVGKQFTEEGALGGTAQKVGGPFDKDGMVGKQFTSDGAIGGTVQNMMGGQREKSN